MAVTLKLPPELKDRVASVVKGTDKTAHAFMESPCLNVTR